MEGTIICLVITFFCSLIFVILGIKQYRSEKPVSINTGEIPPKEEDLISVSEWNHKHGRNLIIFGCLLFITMIVFLYALENMNIGTSAVLFLFAAVFAEIAWVQIQHNIMKKKMIKNK